MSDNGDPDLPTSGPPWSYYTGPIPQYFTRSHHRIPFSTFSLETPTDFSTSTPLPFDVDSLSTPTPTDAGDPMATDMSPWSSDTLDMPTPIPSDLYSPTLTSTDFPSSAALPTDLSSSNWDSLNPSSITIEESDSSTSFFSSDLSTSPFSTFSSSTPSSFTTDPSAFDSSFTTISSSSLTTSSLPQTSTTVIPAPKTSPTPSQINSPATPLSQLSSSGSSSSLVITTSLPSFGSSTQSRTSTTSPGVVIASTAGGIALAVLLALLAILCRKRLGRVHRRTAHDDFLDLDNEMGGVNQPLIIDDGPGPGGAVYSDPFSDEARARTQSRSLSATGRPGTSLASSNSYHAAMGSIPTPVRRGDHMMGPYDQPDSRAPPLQVPPPELVRTRSDQSSWQVQTQPPPDHPVPRRSSPPFDAGAVAYIRDNDQTTGLRPLSPEQFSPKSPDNHRLISAFSVASGLSPQYASPSPISNADETWKGSPVPLQTSLAYRPPIDYRHSLSGHIFEPSDSVSTAQKDVTTQSPPSSFNNTHTGRGGNFGSRPSPITEVSEVNTYSQEGSDNSGGTWNSTVELSSSSTPVVMTAQRIQLTSRSPSFVSQPPSTTGHYGDPPPSSGFTGQVPPPPPITMPPLPQVQPLSLGKRRSVQGTS